MEPRALIKGLRRMEVEVAEGRDKEAALRYGDDGLVCVVQESLGLIGASRVEVVDVARGVCRWGVEADEGGLDKTARDGGKKGGQVLPSKWSWNISMLSSFGKCTKSPRRSIVGVGRLSARVVLDGPVRCRKAASRIYAKVPEVSGY